ncbi:hypothetical protein [Brevibacillus agri]|uniref:hypothetical protein n=1 Tax=Brevibacillus agri TaxID=51101 RepID=UPI003D743D37
MAQLPSTATLAQIIAGLREMEAINQKADLAAAVGSPAAASDDVATIISKLQTAKNTLASNITAQGLYTAQGTESLTALAGKIPAEVRRKATGTVSQLNNGTSQTISGLAFTPSLIVTAYHTSLSMSASTLRSDYATTISSSGFTLWTYNEGYGLVVVETKPTGPSFVITNKSTSPAYNIVWTAYE